MSPRAPGLYPASTADTRKQETKQVQRAKRAESASRTSQTGPPIDVVHLPTEGQSQAHTDQGDDRVDVSGTHVGDRYLNER
jgi:hypothetical protein